MPSGWYQRKFGWVPRPVRQVIVIVIGVTLLALAALGTVVPVMPGFLFAILALVVLAAEFAWAARWLHKVKRGAHHMKNRVKNGFAKRPAPQPIEQKSP